MSKQFWVMGKGTEADRWVCFMGEKLHPALYVSHNSQNKGHFQKAAAVLLSVIWQDLEGQTGLASIRMMLRLHGIRYSDYRSSETSRQRDPLQATGTKLHKLDQNYDNNIYNKALIAVQNWSLLKLVLAN